jgi:RNA polymerase sigma-70 factor (ECF subfamily)
MDPEDMTAMGGPHGNFDATDWTEVVRTRTLHGDRRRAAMEKLIGRYWKPVYCYIRRKGYPNESAKDLTQGFFQDVVLGRGLPQLADRAKGRFRAFLLTSLDRYLTSAHRTEVAEKRLPREGLVSLEGFESSTATEPADDTTPDAAFNYAWASELLNEVLAEVEQQCEAAGEQTHWAVFQARVLRPILEATEPPPLPEICAQHGVADTARASNMLVTVKRRFQASLRRHVRRFVGSDAAVEEEISDLMKIFSDTRARS